MKNGSSKALMNNHINDLPATLFVTDPEGNILMSNEFTALTIGMPLDELIKANVQDLVKAGYYNYSITMEAIQTKQRVTKTIKTNQGFNVLSTAIPIFKNTGEVQLVVTKSNQYKGKLTINDRTYNFLYPAENKKEVIFIGENFRIVAESLAMKQIIKVCNQIATYDTKVLIYGESGTGKEVIARYIHQKSKRCHSPFVSINCASIQPSLFEYELFGYEKGAFEGAVEAKKGLLEAANGGTLFLDEIAELPMDMQAKFLHVIENNEMRRVGAISNKPLNCRIIAATNRELWKMVKKGMFREDLYYRINVIPIHIPPLRNRKLDLVGLVSCFIAEFNQKYDKKFVLSADDFQKILWQEWPGNARELRNYIERLVVTEHDSITNQSKETITDWFTIDHFIKSNIENRWKLKDFTAIAEGRYIQHLLDACDGNVTEAAKKLGVDRSVVYRKLKKIDTIHL
ncbi:Transcriptional regulator containing PAS, AAA-type ATPase, and DNA-binding Fis domains [Evansella caseinilytica]|uniref:Transcriptional regulator containing PAS, AAA-type ATPase, and DNA-binding Fis domains n=1 Tax=Evansella caseinilytica TaxID=1503961 RepID=A0A1H3U4D4_9BACI|nr:sigma 54-interacting transcriptional regulator [Evansella caseinilytica]SDZ57147.1 Transcriptional regulator containing PAS, AAA-type ATPase, and DNA-binding Fis domains [Evansella caseinilytica]